MQNWILILAVTLLTGGCEDEGSRLTPGRLLELVPALRPDLASHLTQDDDEAFRAFCADRLGAEDLLDAFVSLHWTMKAASVSEARKLINELGPCQQRLADVAADQYGLLTFKRITESLRSLDDVALARLVRYEQRRRVAASVDLSREDRVDSLLALLPGAEQMAPIYSRGGLNMELSAVVAGDPVRALGFAHRAMWHLQQDDRAVAVAQLWANLADLHWIRGDADSTWICLDRSREIAIRHRLAALAGRTHEFEGGFRSDLGQLHRATQAFMMAEDLCERLGGRHRTLRFALRLAEFHASLGLWGLVVTDLEHSGSLLRMIPFPATHPERRRLQARRDLLRGRALVATDSTEEGLRLLEGVVDLVRTEERSYGHGRVLWAQLLRWRADALCSLGRWQEASNSAEEGRQHCLRTKIDELAPSMEMQAARASFALGEIDRARRLVASFEKLSDGRPEPFAGEHIQHDRLRVELALAEARHRVAAEVFEQAMTRLAADLHRMEASAETYVFFAQARPLRDLAHGILREDPAAGYAFEMLWRQAAVEIGRDLAARPKPETGGRKPTVLLACAQIVRSHLQGGTEPPLHRLPDLSRQLEQAQAEHWLYALVEDDLVRWIRRGDRVERTVLDAPADAIREMVKAANRLAGRPAPDDDELVDRLTRLGSSLLPERALRASNATGRVLIGVPGLLANLPLGALNTTGNPRDYVPLRGRREVFRLCYRGPPPVPGPASRSLVVANPVVPQTVSGVLGPLPPLTHAETEARAVAAQWVNPVVLLAEHAQKQRVLKEWSHASGIYMAVHHARDPRLRYRSLLPLSGPADAENGSVLDALEESCLNVHDIRAADLTHCELVVLAACASGQRYLDTGISGPSLSEAFIDAGVHMVVQTSWPLRDDRAAALIAAALAQLPNQPSCVVSMDRTATCAGESGSSPLDWNYEIVLSGWPLESNR